MPNSARLRHLALVTCIRVGRRNGWASDEPPNAIGKTLVFPPWLKDREDELRSGLEQAEFV
jgi:hypothetical protein